MSDKNNQIIQNLKTSAAKIKLIATDLDGTLLGPAMDISKANKEALEICASRGIHVVVATGRAVTAIHESVRAIKGIRYLITSNGAKVFDGDTDKQLYAKYLSSEAVENVWDIITDQNVLIEVFHNGSAYISKHVMGDLARYGVPDYFQKYIRETRIPVDDIGAFTKEHLSEIENINFDYSSEEMRNQIFRKLSAFKDWYTLTTSLPFNLEIGGLGVSKATALDFLCKELGIKQEETMCFGDNNNDVSMIEYAGIGIAVGGAVPEAKAAADFVTRDSGDSGVAYAIENILF